jgi:DNA-directed RNA polymerase specialized sigma subunit
MNKFNDREDIKNIAEWQKSGDENKLTELITRYQPIVHSITNRYRTTGVAPATLRAKANAQLLKAFKTYDPTKGASPVTHVWNNLQKVQRVATESLQSGHIPEYRNLKKSTFTIVRDNLTDQLGREPNVSEMADELGWSHAEVGRMNNELSGEVTASGAEFDFYGNAVTQEPKDKLLADYLYHELDNKDKLIFEHTFGYGGKKILNNKELAKKLRTNEMSIHRSKSRLADKIRSYR